MTGGQKSDYRGMSSALPKNVVTGKNLPYMYVHACMCTYVCHIAALGSILDSPLSWEFGKFQLVRWSHRVALWSSLDHPPTTHPPTEPVGNRKVKLFLSMLCGVPTPIVPPPLNEVCAVHGTQNDRLELTVSTQKSGLNNMHRVQRY